MRREQVSKFFLVMTGLLPFMLSAQSPQQTKLTEAGNKTLIESGTVNLKTGADAKMDASLRTADTLLLLTLSGSGVGTATIDASDEVVFVLDNDSSVTVKSTGFQGIESKDFVNSYRHDYAISRDALETLSRHNLRRVRKYAMTEHKDIYLDEKSAGNLRGLCASFLEELYRLRPLMVSSAAPAFPGGKEVFLAFLKRNLKLQSAAVEGPKQALVQFRRRWQRKQHSDPAIRRRPVRCGIVADFKAHAQMEAGSGRRQGRTGGGGATGKFCSARRNCWGTVLRRVNSACLRIHHHL
jgi:hypothetical protein